MARKLIQLLLTVSLVVVSGPIAPCKLARAFCGHSERSSAARVSAAMMTAGLQVPPEEDGCPDSDCSCWCSVHMSGQEVATITIMPPALIAFVSKQPALASLSWANAARFEDYGLEPPEPSHARSLPLLT